MGCLTLGWTGGALEIMELKIGDRVRTPGGRTGVVVRLDLPASGLGEVNKYTVHEQAPRVARVLMDDTDKEERVLVKELSPADSSK